MGLFPASPRRFANPSAFTLVELMVAVGIIAILICILLPSLTKAKEQANKTICLSHLRQLGVGFVMYSEANHGYLPMSGVAFIYSSGQFNDSLGTDWIGWQSNFKTLDGGAIAPYVGNPNPRLVGDIRTIPASTLNSAASGMTPALFRCPSDDWTVRTSGTYGSNNPYPYSYSMNEMLGPGFGFQGLAPTGPKEQILCAAKITQVRTPSSKLLLYEEDSGTIDDGNAQPNCLGNSRVSLLSLRHSNIRNYAAWNGTGVPNASGRGNVAFCDGSAAFITRSLAHASQSFYPLW